MMVHSCFFLSLTLLRTHFRCRLLSHLVIINDTHTHTQTTLGRTPLDDDQPESETSTWQHTTLKRDRHPYSQRYSYPQSQQTRGRRTTPETARPPGSAICTLSVKNKFSSACQRCFSTILSWRRRRNASPKSWYILYSFFTKLMHKFFILIHLLYSFTCFEHYCAHLQEDNCISTAVTIPDALLIQLSYWRWAQ